jgi:hydroxyacylglutathione hydrolase
MNSLNDRTDLIAKTQRISPTALREYQGETTILDIRSENERKAGHITNSIHIPLNHLVDRITEIPLTGKVIVHCQGGYRSMIAASLLEKENRDNVLDLAGGYQAWVSTQNPVHIPAS